MATCGHCHKTGQTVAHVRTCGQGTVTTLTPELPLLAVGNVVTLADEDGYWTVEHVPTAGTWIGVTQVRADTRTGETSRTPDLTEVELVFTDLNAAAEYRIAQGDLTTRERISETLHGDPNYCRGCAKGWAGEKWHRADCKVIAARHEAARDDGMVDVPGLPGVRVPAPPEDPWKQVDGLRERVAEHLHRETRQGGSPRVEGRFAIVVDGVTKFLRIKKVTSGRWAGRVFVDSMGSDTGYPVKAPATLTTYLSAVLVDPQAAAKRYADELGECSDCGRPLTNDESRARGIGPECWAKH